jgi:hypothetical protein
MNRRTLTSLIFLILAVISAGAGANKTASAAAMPTAQAIANHESPRTAKLYDSTDDEITLDEVDRIRI